MVLSSVLSLVADKSTYKATYNYWREKMLEAKKERDGKPIHEKTERQEENWLTWEEVQKKKEELQKAVDEFVGAKHITTAQYDKLLHFVVLSLYTDIAPRRNQDFLDMYVIKKYTKDHDGDKNYYDLTHNKFIFNKYKTAKKWGQQMVDVPAELQTTLAKFIKHHPLAKQKTKEYKLLVKQDGSNLNSVNAITRMLNRIFGKKVGSSMLRHAYLSSKYGEASKEMEEDARDMGHSLTQQKEYIKH